MPHYDYYCAANDRTVEVNHSIREVFHTWGEVCERAGIDPGDTPANTPAQRLISGGIVLTEKRSQGEAPPPSCCGPVGCGCN
jgi:hypothetical protein